MSERKQKVQKPVKVRVSMVIPIDPAAWMLNYGCDQDEIAEDVRHTVDQVVGEYLANLGVLAEAEL